MQPTPRLRHGCNTDTTRAARLIRSIVSVITRMDQFTSLKGPVELIDGKLMLRIPLEAGGKHLVACSRGIGVVEDDLLCIHIMDWLAQKLGILDGSTVLVDNANGKFNIRVCDDETDT